MRRSAPVGPQPHSSQRFVKLESVMEEEEAEHAPISSWKCQNDFYEMDTQSVVASFIIRILLCDSLKSPSINEHNSDMINCLPN